jgi:hypothetical protein
MLIRLTKAKNSGKQDRLTCVRDDGSQTSWALSSHFAQHDLLHYVVETTLGLEEAFFGLIARGREIDSFGTRDGEKDVYTKDEGDAELIVGLLQGQMQTGDLPGHDEFLAMLSLTCEKRDWPVPQYFSEEQLDDIKQQISDLEAKWQRLPSGESMELVFPM